MMKDADHRDAVSGLLQEELARGLRDWLGLRQLTHVLARSSEPNDIIKGLFSELPSLIDADVIGVSRINPYQVWTWSKPQYGGRADALRLRLGGQPGQPMEPGDRVMVSCDSRRQRRVRHLSLVPKQAVLPAGQEDLGAGMYEVRMTMGSAIEGVLYIERNTGQPFTEQERLLVDTIATVLSLALGHAVAHRQLREANPRDPLTGVFDLSSLKGVLQREMRQGYRYGARACLLFLDLDYFTVVNERLGYAAGDTVLKRVASLVEENVRDVDSVSRYSGEAFAVVLPHTGLAQAQALAERIRAEVERRAFEVDGGHVRLTTSIGLAACDHARGEPVTAWMADAESALYEAKARGRNCVVTHASPPVAPARAVLSLVA